MNGIVQLWYHLTFIVCSSVHRAYFYPSDITLTWLSDWTELTWHYLALRFIISLWDYYISIFFGLLCLIPWRSTDRIWWSLWTLSQNGAYAHWQEPFRISIFSPPSSASLIPSSHSCCSLTRSYQCDQRNPLCFFFFCFIMLCYFLLYSKVNQLYVYIYLFSGFHS